MPLLIWLLIMAQRNSNRLPQMAQSMKSQKSGKAERRDGGKRKTKFDRKIHLPSPASSSYSHYLSRCCSRPSPFGDFEAREAGR